MATQKQNKQTKEKTKRDSTWGRPIKLSETWIQCAEEVLTDNSVIILTDEELLFNINERAEELSIDNTISERTFQKYKAWDVAWTSDEERELLESFRRLIKKALVREKKSLFSKMWNDPIWQKWAWIIERKFSEWNLKQITDNTNRQWAPITNSEEDDILKMMSA